MRRAATPPLALRAAADKLERARNELNPSESKRLLVEARGEIADVLDAIDDFLSPSLERSLNVSGVRTGRIRTGES